MPKKLITIIIGLVMITGLTVIPTNAQGDEAFRIKLESILSKFKNYRFSTISVYQVSDIGDIRRAIRKKEEEELLGEAGGDANAECAEQLDAAVRSILDQQVQTSATLSQVERELLRRGLTDYDKTTLECAFNYFVAKYSGDRKILSNAYVVTTRKSRDELVPNTIIAMIVSYENQIFVKDNLKQPSPSNVYTYPELINFDLTEYGDEFSSPTLYDLVVNAFQQGLVRDKTLEAQGIGSNMFTVPKVGVSKSLIEQENKISEADIQAFRRITQGQPHDVVDKTHEIVAGPDLISYKKLKYPLRVYSDGYVDTISNVTNTALPQYGVELKYGIESINYPSLWSERMTLSAVWQNAKLGFILPTNGWSALAEDGFNQERRLTYGGLGIAGSFDFPVNIIPESGIFHLDFGFVFGDAEDPSLVNRSLTDLNPYLPSGNPADMDYLVRFNTQLHYTFGIAIDDDYQLRFGLGGTIYSIEAWDYESEQNDEFRFDHNFVEMDTETVGGISGRIDFMVKNKVTPYGASLQYFDEGIFGNIWLQIPIVRNTFALKLNASGFNKAFGDEPRAWEERSIIIPSANFIVNF